MTLSTFARGRTALVTGASSGIGAELATQLGAAGAHVVLVARSEAALEAVAARIRAGGGTATAVPADLEATDAAEALVASLGERRDVDVLVANAGFGVNAPFAETDPAAVRGMVALNVLALTDLTRLLLPGMLARRRGGVLTVASTSAFVPAPTFAVYAATKAYVLSLTDALHAELRGSGVHATCLCPGPVPTAFGDRAGMRASFFSGPLSGALPADAVARAGLEALAANRRRVVPGAVNKLLTAATPFVPTGLTMRVARSFLARGRGQ